MTLSLCLPGLSVFLRVIVTLPLLSVPVPTTLLPSLMVTVPVALDDEPLRVTVTVPLAFLPNLTVFGKAALIVDVAFWTVPVPVPSEGWNGELAAGVKWAV